MNYKTMGRTGLSVSALGFGGIPIQRIDAEGTKALIRQLADCGVNYIDTARGYTVSEEYLGYALEGIREQFILATKTMARTKEGMAKDIDTSLRNLRTNDIELYQVHNPSLADLDTVCAPGGALEALLEAKGAGKIGHIGITAHSVEVFEKALSYDWVETIMFPYNIVETQGEALIHRCKERNVGFIAMKPLAGGAIEDATLALRFLNANDDVSVVIPGMADPAELAQNLAAVKDTTPCPLPSWHRSMPCAGSWARSSAAAAATAPPALWASTSPAFSSSRGICAATVWPIGPRIATLRCPSRPAPVSAAANANPAAPTNSPSGKC